MKSDQLTRRRRGATRAVALCARISVVVVSFVTIAAKCGDGEGGFEPTLDASDGDGAINRARCPSAAPSEGESCVLPEGTTCDFGQCGTRLATCGRGRWTFGTNPAPAPNCPSLPPEVDAACPACWPASATCTYGSTDCSQPDASLNTAVASCPNGAWVLDIRPCRDGGEPDVQGDAEPDAD